MADQNFIPPNLPIEEKKSEPAPLPPSPNTGGSVSSIPASAVNPSSKSVENSTVTPVSVPDSRPVKSYIRTMDSDIKSVQMGQAPRGTEKSLPAMVFTEDSKVAGTQGGASGLATPPKPAPAVEIKLSKPESGVSMPFYKKEEVKIKVDALKPTPQIVIPALPSAPKPPVFPPTFSRPEPRPVPVPITPPTRLVLPPIPPVVGSFKPVEAKPPTKPAIIPPPQGVSISTAGIKSFIGPKMLIPGAILLLLAITGLGYWFFVLRGTETVIDESPNATPSTSMAVSVQPTLRVSKLISFFPAHYLLPVGKGQGKTLTSVLPEIEHLSLADSRENILLDPRMEGGEDYPFSKFLDRFLVNFPVNLLSAVDEKDFDLVWSTQKELFNTQGKPVLNGSGLEERRLALAVRVTSAEQARKTMLEWESSMADDWQNFFVFPAPTTQTSFLPASYRDVAIRYLNFNYPDYSIDYAIVTANNNDDYLIISNSREQIFGIIDALLGFGR